jgi:hypothetical protein
MRYAPPTTPPNRIKGTAWLPRNSGFEGAGVEGGAVDDGDDEARGPTTDPARQVIVTGQSPQQPDLAEITGGTTPVIFDVLRVR